MSARDAYIEKMKLQLDESELTLARLDESRAAGESTWDPMIAEMDKMRSAFIQSFHYLKSQS